MRITRSHNLGRDEARRRLDKVANTLSDQFSLRSEWAGDTLTFRGSSVNGRVDVDDESITLDVKLGFALKMMEPTVNRAIEHALDKELDGPR